MFMCSRDHLTMDLDKQSLELMLQLLSGGDSDEAMSPDKTGRLTGIVERSLYSVGFNANVVGL